MECNEKCLYLVPGPCILIVGFILHVIGLSTTFWSVPGGSGTHAGLWKVCTMDDTKEEVCFSINQRGSVHPMVFLCSFLVTISTILIGLSAITAACSLCQTRSRIVKWSKNSAAVSLFAVVLSVCAECVYGARFLSITYHNIPNLKDNSTGNTLEWSFYLLCGASVLVLSGSIYLIIVPVHVLSTGKVSSTMQQIPILQIHPPPSDRTPTPLYLLSQRSSSPLPSPFSTKAGHPHPRSLPPVFTQLRK